MLFYAITGLINGLTSIFLGGLILKKKNYSKINIIFALFCFSIALWSFGYFFWMLSSTYDAALLWVRILMAGSIFIPVTFLHFVSLFLHYPQIEKNIKWGYILFGFFLVWDFTPLYIRGLKTFSSFSFWPEPGIVFHFFLFLWAVMFIFCFVLLFNALYFQNFDSRKKKQISLLLWGVIIGVLGGGTNYFLWYDIPIPPVGNILVVFFVFATFYAIAKYRLMDIKLVLRKSSVFLLSIVVVFLFGIGVKVFYEYYISIGLYVGDVLMLATAVFLYDPIKNRFFILANKYFFSTYYDTRKVISDVSENLRSFLDTEKIYDYIEKRLREAFHFTAFGVLSYDEDRKQYKIVYNQGFNVEGKQFFRKDKRLHQDFIDKNRPIVVEEVKNMYQGGNVKKMVEYLEKMGVEVLAPLNSQEKNVGLLVFGPKESGDMYNEEDLEVIKIVGSQAAVTIENARLYEQAKNFNIKLKDEVDKATKELRSANERLRRLDQAKTDFLSIASHQLRTPLTVIKGYISMLLEGTFGKLGKKQEKALHKVFDSSERLIDLIEDLLNVSRIQSGRMEYNFKKSSLKDLVQDVHEELRSTAEKKGLKFDLKQPSGSLPQVSMDPEKMRQVVMNLSDNAIKYTQEGSVTLNLSRTKKGVKFSVEDTGMGMTSDDIDNLFQKFSRNEKTDLVHTEGTGLGLYVAKQIVQDHGGKIWAESEGKGKGSKFCFTLPVKKNSKKKK